MISPVHNDQASSSLIRLGKTTPCASIENPPGKNDKGVLSDESLRKEVQDLKKHEQEVKAHESAHLAAGAGVVAGGAVYTYSRGPDGRLYVSGGEVKIDLSAENDPQQTIRKMQQARRAALAPAEPSGQDRAVAAQAYQIEAQARQEKAQKDPKRENPLGVDSSDEVRVTTGKKHTGTPSLTIPIHRIDIAV